MVSSEELNAAKRKMRERTSAGEDGDRHKRVTTREDGEDVLVDCGEGCRAGLRCLGWQIGTGSARIQGGRTRRRM